MVYDTIIRIVEALLVIGLGLAGGKILVGMRGQRWRNSIRGLLFATTLIAVALALLVWAVRN